MWFSPPEIEDPECWDRYHLLRSLAGHRFTLGDNGLFFLQVNTRPEGVFNPGLRLNRITKDTSDQILGSEPVIVSEGPWVVIPSDGKE